MKSVTYQKRLERHLGEYRLGRLGVEKMGTFAYKGTARPYQHILPPSLKWLNLLEPFRKEIRERYPNLKWHKYFHHLNSSQAFALNLFVPFMLESPAVVAEIFGGGPIAGFEPERIEDSEEATNVDMWWQSEGGVATYCEVKLSESGFGGAKGDARHLKKLSNIYRPPLSGRVPDSALHPRAFFSSYQIYRYLWLASREGHERDQVRFLLPKANVGLDGKLQLALEVVHASLRSRVQILYMEPVLERLTQDEGLGWYARLLQEKYVPR